MSKSDTTTTTDTSTASEPPVFQLPDTTTSDSWQRATVSGDKSEHATLDNPAERVVQLPDGSAHRCLFCIHDRTLRGLCSCAGFEFGETCAHLTHLWVLWTRGRIRVPHVETGREYELPPEWLLIETSPASHLHALSPRVLDSYLACELGGVGPREWAEFRGVSPGTIGNQLRTARDALGRDA